MSQNKNIDNKYKVKNIMKSRYFFDNHKIEWGCCYTLFNKKSQKEFPLLKEGKKHIDFNEFVKSNKNNSYSPVAWDTKYSNTRHLKIKNIKMNI
jgi:hypothetical protein